MRTPLLTAALLAAACSRADIVYRPDEDLALYGAGGEDDPADVADPHVIRVDSRWYLYGTHSLVDLEAWSSDDLAHWTWEGVIWAPEPGAWNDHPTIWAPHVQAADDGFYLYYSANGRVGLAFAEAPTGPFVDVRPGPFAGGGAAGIGDGVYVSDPYDVDDPLSIVRDAEEYAIDAFVHEASDGSLTFYCARLVPWSVIVAIPMVDPETLADVAPTVVLTVDADARWEGLTREAPWILEEGGRTHLMYSGNQWWTASYAIGVATGAGPLGPFTRTSEDPWFASDPARSIFGPGHHSVAPGAHDDLLLFYHSKVDATDYSARRTRYALLRVDGDGGLSLE